MAALLTYEKDVLGFHISGHPLDQHDAAMRTFRTATVAAAKNMNDEAAAVLGVMLSSVRITQVRNGPSAGEKMAMLTVVDKTGTMDGVVFASTFKEAAMHLQDGQPVFLTGRIDRKRGEPQIIVDQVIKPEDAPRYLAGAIELDFIEDADGMSLESTMSMAAGLIQQHAITPSGNGARPAEIYINVITNGKRVQLRSGKLRAVAEPLLLNRLNDLLGANCVRLRRASSPPVRRNGTRGNGIAGNRPKRQAAGV
jgi:DNA polymerase III subunit alpha